MASSNTGTSVVNDRDDASGRSLRSGVQLQGLLEGDRGALLAIVGLLALLTVLAWHRWALPATDPGLDLTAADLISHGALPYRDINFFYGPAGIYALAMWFKLFGVSLASAVAFGYVQALAILGVAYALARVWLRPLAAGLTVGWVAAASFTGGLANLVLPHSNSATVGILFVLLECLAVARRRPWLAGVAAAGACLTRPEYVVAAAAIGLGAMLGAARESGQWRAGVRDGVRVALPTLLLAGGVWAFLANEVGANALLYQDLFPSSFVKVASQVQLEWAPFDITSAVTTFGRILVYGALATAFVMSWIGVRAVGERTRTGGELEQGGAELERSGAGRARARGEAGTWRARLTALWPVVIAVVGLVALDGVLRVTSIAGTSRGLVEHEVTHLLIGMSWLPVVSIVAALWALFRARRPGAAPLGGSWPADLALLLVAAALSLRVYNKFTPATYAPYYAALPMLVAVIAHEAIGRWRRAALVPLRICIALCAVTLVGHGYLSVLRANTTPVHAARGTFLEPRSAAVALQGTLDFLRARTHPGEPIVVLPNDAGVYFLAGLKPAIHEPTVFPGILDSAAQARTIAQLQRVRPRFVVIAARVFSDFPQRYFGVEYGQQLMASIERDYTLAATFSPGGHVVQSSAPAERFSVYELRAPAPAGPAAAGSHPAAPGSQ